MDGSGFPPEPGSSRQRQQSQPIEDDEAQDRGTQYLGSGQQRRVDPGLPHQANGLHRQRRKYEISVAGWGPERYGVRHIPHQEQYPQAAHHRRAGHASQFEGWAIRAGPEQEGQRALEVYQEHRTDQTARQIIFHEEWVSPWLDYCTRSPLSQEMYNKNNRVISVRPRPI